MRTLYFEDIHEDLREGGASPRRYESDWYTVSRDEIVAFAERWDPYDFHIDENAAADSIFGGLSACAAHIFAINSRLNHDLEARPALVAGLGGDGLNLLHPVGSGDRVRLVRRYTEARESKSRPEAGVVHVEDCLESPDGLVVFRTSGAILVARRPS